MWGRLRGPGGVSTTLPQVGGEAFAPLQRAVRHHRREPLSKEPLGDRNALSWGVLPGASAGSDPFRGHSGG